MSSAARASRPAPSSRPAGCKIITTLDWRLQQIAEKWVKAAAILPHTKDPKAFAKQIGVPYESWMANLRDKNLYNGALVAIDYQTGQIMAYVGSADYYATQGLGQVPAPVRRAR